MKLLAFNHRFILFHSVEDLFASASMQYTLISLLLTNFAILCDIKENACYAVLIWNHLEFMTTNNIFWAIEIFLNLPRLRFDTRTFGLVYLSNLKYRFSIKTVNRYKALLINNIAIILDKFRVHGTVRVWKGPHQANLVLIACASSKGSGEPAHPRRLTRTSAARSYKQWVKRNLQTESQIPGPSQWLGMRS